MLNKIEKVLSQFDKVLAKTIKIGLKLIAIKEIIETLLT